MGQLRLRRQPRLNDRSRFSEETFAGAHANGREAPSGHYFDDDVTGAFDSDCRRPGRPSIDCYKNPIESQGIAATMSSEITSAPMYGQMRHSESSGLVRPIAQALKKPTPKGGAKRP